MSNAKVRTNALALFKLLQNSSPGEFWGDFDENFEKKEDIKQLLKQKSFKKRKGRK